MSKYKVDRRFKKITKISFSVAKENHSLIKNKLHDFKELIKHLGILKHEIKERKKLEEQNKDVTQTSLNILHEDKEVNALMKQMIIHIEQQDKILRTIYDEIIDSDYKRNLDVTENNLELYSIVEEGESILKRLFGTFHSQQFYLEDTKLTIEESVEKFKEFFHDELHYYKDYEQLLEKVPEILKNDIKYFMSDNFKRKKSFQTYLIIMFILDLLVGLLSMKENETQIQYLAKVTQTTVINIIGAGIFSQYYKEGLKKIKYISKKIKKSLKN